MRTALALSALLAAAACSTEPEAPAEPVATRPAPLFGNDPLSRLEGSWRSTSDAESVVTFGEGTFVDEYAGGFVGEGGLEVGDGCGGVVRGEFSFTVLEDGEATCYHVLEAGDETLAYAPSGGAGDTLTFTRDD